MKQVYQVGVIGCGMIATSAHIPAIQALEDRMQIVAVADARPEAASVCGERLGVPYYTDVDKMFDEYPMDLAVVATPNASHVYYSLKALRRGVNVVCEKPIALKYKDILELYEAADQNGVQYFPGQTSRFKQDMMSLIEFAKLDQFGEIYYCEAHTFRRWGVPRWGSFHQKELNAAGAFSDQHLVDFLVALCGAPEVASVSAATYAKLVPQNPKLHMNFAESGSYGASLFVPRPYKDEEFNVEEFGTCFIRFKNGTTFVVRTAWAINQPDTKGMVLKICGTKGGYMMPENKIIRNMGPYRTEVTPQIVDMTHNAIANWGHWGMFEHIVDCLDGKCEYTVTRKEAEITAAIMEMFYLSAEQGREVRVEEVIG